MGFAAAPQARIVVMFPDYELKFMRDTAAVCVACKDELGKLTTE